jgi:hypothetical protein
VWINGLQNDVLSLSSYEIHAQKHEREEATVMVVAMQCQAERMVCAASLKPTMIKVHNADGVEGKPTMIESGGAADGVEETDDDRVPQC